MPSPDPLSVAGAPPQVRLSAHGWTSRLTLVVLAGLALETATGFWTLFAPFSLLGQFQVLLHTVAGLLLLTPYAAYQLRHWRDWSDQTLSVVKVLGYAAMVVTLGCMASGLVVSAQALVGRRITVFWDRIHLTTGLATGALVVIHLIMAWVRRRDHLARLDGFPSALRRRRRLGVAVLAALYAAVVLALSLAPRVAATLPMPTDYTMPEYAQQFAEYRGSPFAPSFARTSTGGLVNPAVLGGSDSCGTAGCHEQIHHEWLPSAHRFSAMNPPFQAVQRSFADDRHPAETRYCAGCHDPISLFAGAKDIHNLSLSAPGMQEGISCIVCHTISHVDERGNADYVLTPPARYLGEGTTGLTKRISDFLIRAYPRQHLADYDRNILRTPEFCGACHKQVIPEALNRFGASPAQNQFDEWRKSHWHNSMEPDKSLSCRDCHMRLVHGSTDPGAGEGGDLRRAAGDGAHRHHGTIATNLFMPEVLQLPERERHVALTRDWIEGRTVIPEIAHLWPEGPVAAVEIEAPATAAPGEILEFSVSIRNRKAGHNFITGPLDFLRAWLHVTVEDADGHRLAEWGGIDPVTRDILDEPGAIHEAGRPRDAGTLVLESIPVDDQGAPILRHELWRKAGAAATRIVVARYSDRQVYRVAVRDGARSPLRVRADLNFRRYRQEFLNLVLPEMESESGVYQPTLTKDSATREIPLADAVAPASASAPAAARSDGPSAPLAAAAPSIRAR
ncbi:MAG: hypothetical protein IAE82_05140 [Opitutaceae bacterium]|nr:hypothetical protein [Opitutaceae bacterium]